MKKVRYAIIVNATTTEWYEEYTEAINDYDFLCETYCRENYEITLLEYNKEKNKYEILHRATFFAKEEE